VLLPFVIVGVPAALLLAAVCWTLRGIWLCGRPRAVERGDAIVVFGAEATPDGPSPELAARLDHAAELYRRGMAPAVLCCGGRSGPVSEAATMAAFLRGRGLPPDAVLTDEACPSTRAALAATRRHGAAGWGNVLLVSSPYHLYRIMCEARRWGVRAIACPTGRTPVMSRLRTMTRQVIREVAAVWWYAVKRIETQAPARGDAAPLRAMPSASDWSPMAPEVR
jgi:uncharacterized SAM-binding protein YcdF (DUF218 family)